MHLLYTYIGIIVSDIEKYDVRSFMFTIGIVSFNELGYVKYVCYIVVTWNMHFVICNSCVWKISEK